MSRGGCSRAAQNKRHWFPAKSPSAHALPGEVKRGNFTMSTQDNVSPSIAEIDAARAEYWQAVDEIERKYGYRISTQPTPERFRSAAPAATNEKQIGEQPASDVQPLSTTDSTNVNNPYVHLASQCVSLLIAEDLILVDLDQYMTRENIIDAIKLLAYFFEKERVKPPEWSDLPFNWR